MVGGRVAVSILAVIGADITTACANSIGAADCMAASVEPLVVNLDLTMKSEEVAESVWG